jgi:tetratricopeptide (TPR) repeat protein
MRDGDDRFARPARPYQKSRDASTAKRGGPRGASSRSPYSRPADTRTPAPLTPEQRKRQAAGERAREKGWGSVARKGAVNITSTGQELGDAKSRTRTPDPLGDFVSVDRPTPRKTETLKTKQRAKYALPGDVSADVRKAFIGTAYMREKMVNTLTRAAEAYDRKRYEEALRLGRMVADATPGVAAVRELTGLAAYRAERWAMSRIHLRAYFTISGDPEHLPLVMDADRANHKYRAVEKTFVELQESEPSPEVLAEGRIVMAATWADQGKYEEAIDLLTRAGAAKSLRNPSYRHVRLWYALADVYDRAGDTTSARELFSRVVLAEPDAYDAAARLNELGASAPRKNRKRRATPTSKKNVD